MKYYRSDEYYYDEDLYSREIDDGRYEDYNSKPIVFAQPQSREAKEISNYSTKFHNQDTRHRLHVSESGNLVLEHVTRVDKGSYVCKATNMVGSKSSEAAILSVHGKYKY